MVARSPKTVPTLSLFEEKVVPFCDLCKQLSFDCSIESLQGWARDGIMNRFTKVRVKLECIRLPRGYGSSHAAVQRFLRAINEQVKPDPKNAAAKKKRKKKSA